MRPRPSSVRPPQSATQTAPERVRHGPCSGASAAASTLALYAAELGVTPEDLGAFTYRTVTTEADVSEWERSTARQTLDNCTRDLQLTQRPVLTWVRPMGTELLPPSDEATTYFAPVSIDGFQKQGQVFIVVGLPTVARLVTVVAHEVCHAWQFQRGLCVADTPYELLEEHAELYGIWYCQRTCGS